MMSSVEFIVSGMRKYQRQRGLVERAVQNTCFLQQMVPVEAGPDSAPTVVVVGIVVFNREAAPGDADDAPIETTCRSHCWLTSSDGKELLDTSPEISDIRSKRYCPTFKSWVAYLTENQYPPSEEQKRDMLKQVVDMQALRNGIRDGLLDNKSTQYMQDLYNHIFGAAEAAMGEQEKTKKKKKWRRKRGGGGGGKKAAAPEGEGEGGKELE